MICHAIAISVASAAFGSGAADSEAIEKLAKTLTVGEVVVGMTVGVVDAEGVRHVWGFGTVSLESDQAPDASTVYEIGSVTKVFTGVLLADADARGLLSINTPVRDILPPDVALPSTGESEMTLFHLATHTAGLPRLPPNFSTANAKDPYASYSRSDLHEGLASTKLQAAPGYVCAYSNFGAGLLGDLLAQSSNQSYEDLLAARITRPMGLDDTFVMLDREHRDRMARGHDADLDPVTNWEFDALVGAGGIRSTVDDMLNFAEAALVVLEAQKPGNSMPTVSSPVMSALKKSLERQWPEEPKPARVGLGWHFGADGVTRWHNGQTGGFHSFVAVDPDHGTAVVILANTASHMIDQLGGQILQVLAGETPAPLAVRIPVGIEVIEPRRYEGEYVSNIGAVMKVTSRDGRLYVQLQQQPRMRIYPAAVDRFFVRRVDADIHFYVDHDADEAHLLMLQQNGRETEFERVNAAKTGDGGADHSPSDR